MLAVGCEQEIIQELGNTHFTSVAQINVFGNVLYHINHLHLFVELQTFLTIIPETNGFSDIKMTAVGLNFA